ncbi:MAG: alkaline phosphatase [Polyangiaceae bacterium]|nr:alkaline phosphatase [Polyangiaceae bacterium]
MRPSQCLVYAASIALLAACAGADDSTPEPSSGAPARRVLVVGIDGARADAVVAADTPTLDRLAAEGAYSFQASTQLTAVAVSSPGWASVLTGVEADKHGTLDNATASGPSAAYPTLLARARSDVGARTQVVANWLGLLTLVEDEAEGPAIWYPSDTTVTARTLELIVGGARDVYFAHFDDVDHAGHTYGFGPGVPEYIAAIEEKDAELGELVAAIEARTDEEWLVLVTSDHGGEGTDHGAQNAANQTVFLVAWGAGVVPGELVAATHMDTAPTALAFLGLEISPAWDLDGEVVGLP